MSESRLVAHRRRIPWRWVLLGTLALSLLINLALAVKIAIFDSNYPFRPLCFGEPHLGIIVLNEPMNEQFKDRMQWAIWNSRVSRDDILYISYWKWWRNKEGLWNTSRSVAEYVYVQQKGGTRMTDEERDKLRTSRCKFIRKYALKKRDSR